MKPLKSTAKGEVTKVTRGVNFKKLLDAETQYSQKQDMKRV